jgi:hypothetical protein
MKYLTSTLVPIIAIAAFLPACPDTADHALVLNVTGLPPSAADRILTNHGFSDIRFGEEFGISTRPGLIASQDPTPRTYHPRSAPVTLNVAKGPEPARLLPGEMGYGTTLFRMQFAPLIGGGYAYIDYSSSGDGSNYLGYIDSEGIRQWQLGSSDGTWKPFIVALEPTSDGNMVWTGDVKVSQSDESYSSATVVQKVSAYGSVLWEAELEWPVYSYGLVVREFAGNDILVMVNQYYEDEKSVHGFGLHRISEQGEVVWSKTFYQPGGMYPIDMVVTQDDRIYCMWADESALQLLMLDAMAKPVWEIPLESEGLLLSGDNYPNMAVTSDGGCLINMPLERAMVVSKFTQEGQLSWERPIESISENTGVRAYEMNAETIGCIGLLQAVEDSRYYARLVWLNQDGEIVYETNSADWPVIDSIASFSPFQARLTPDKGWAFFALTGGVPLTAIIKTDPWLTPPDTLE